MFLVQQISILLYADDTVYTSFNSHSKSDMNALQEWLYSNNVLLNKGKSHTTIFGTKRMFKLNSNNIK